MHWYIIHIFTLTHYRTTGSSYQKDVILLRTFQHEPDSNIFCNDKRKEQEETISI